MDCVNIKIFFKTSTTTTTICWKVSLKEGLFKAEIPKLIYNRKQRVKTSQYS